MKLNPNAFLLWAILFLAGYLYEGVRMGLLALIAGLGLSLALSVID